MMDRQVPCSEGDLIRIHEIHGTESTMAVSTIELFLFLSCVRCRTEIESRHKLERTRLHAQPLGGC